MIDINYCTAYNIKKSNNLSSVAFFYYITIQLYNVILSEIIDTC